ncbi:hypothetical protein GT037_009935 [Alternaria burnsii]|uniref:Heterokaryon incompatibility domain-containing protein n=1 Tax=Alternaria burnsii TaxID=1187904 RepID=A0A8H7EBP0_9PLEO|nr:uncharacterized protein GT037_009935 [Alternaria burnsii]KAF7672036.1 hypothetical protein GT037_009935 [Alternaria burnsii]CAI9630115.1 unnamed protein product [Alternaria burnsii]
MITQDASSAYDPDPNFDDRWSDDSSTSSDEGGTLSLAHETETRLDMIKSWIKACDENHGLQCCTPKADASIWPMWVIDVVDECIVEGDIADRYLTLSYVWGGVQTLQATTTNFEKLKRPGSLGRDEVVLPKTIRQAIDVTRLLGERYIWIDQLSILQDDCEHKHSQIKHMAEIYANSYLTLVAATGDTADFGLVDDIDQMLNETPQNNGINDELYTRMFLKNRSPWNRRGWTFQESVFSRRNLFVLDLAIGYGEDPEACPKSLYWVCQQTWWYDWHPAAATKLHRSLYKPMDHQSLSIKYQASWPDFRRYLELCQSYSPRHFTYDSDVFLAFTGAATLLEKSFLGGILYGLPVLFFDIALLWSHFGIASKRKWDATHDESSQPPSWSWMSWHGELLSLYWKFAYEGIAYEKRPSTLVITPLVQWYFTGVGGAQIAITNEYHKYNHLAQDDKSTPPAGWSRTKSSLGNSGMHGENVYFTHNAPGMKFRFPIPLVDPSYSEVTMPVPVTNRITCQTERAFFYLAKSEHQYTPRPRSLVFDAVGSYSGFITLPGDWHTSYFETETRIELIAISTGSVAGHDLRYKFDAPEQFHELGSIWKFYNVLWIDWTDGVAYRKAVGQITKAIWEAADRELIDVVLG